MVNLNLQSYVMLFKLKFNLLHTLHRNGFWFTYCTVSVFTPSEDFIPCGLLYTSLKRWSISILGRVTRGCEDLSSFNLIAYSLSLWLFEIIKIEINGHWRRIFGPGDRDFDPLPNHFNLQLFKYYTCCGACVLCVCIFCLSVLHSQDNDVTLITADSVKEREITDITRLR